jgi:hypothetical protein
MCWGHFLTWGALTSSKRVLATRAGPRLLRHGGVPTLGTISRVGPAFAIHLHFALYITSNVYTLSTCPSRFNRPLIPFRLPHHWLQRALNRQHLTQRTLRKRHGTLVLGVECIILAFHRVPQIPHASVWMQFLPRSCTRATFAALEREQQSIQTGNKRCDGPVTYSR